MKKVFVLLCLIAFILPVSGQRSVQSVLPDKLFYEGRDFFEINNYNGCIDKINAFLKLSNNADLIQESNYMLAACDFIQGKEGAEESLKNYLNKYSDSRHANEAYFMLGTISFEHGNYQNAITWLEKTNADLLSSSNQEKCFYRLAFSLMKTGSLDKARGYFARIAEIGHDYRDASAYYTAYIDYSNKKYDKALEGFSKMKNVSGYKQQASYFITQIDFIQNKYESVISEGNALLNEYPNNANNAELYRMLGNSYYHVGNQTKAINNLSKYVSMTANPLRSDLYILGVCYFNEGEYSSAANTLGKTVKENDALTQNAYLYLGQSYLKLKNKNNARMAFESAATANFDKKIKEVAMYNYALLIHETSFTGFGESVTNFENFLNEFPNSQYADKVSDYLVETYLTTKNYEAALNSINKIKQPDRKILTAKQGILFQLGTQAFANMKIAEAKNYFTKTIEMGDYDAEALNNAYFWRGESKYRQQNFSGAIADYNAFQNKATDKGTDMYPLSFYNLGYCHFKQKEYTNALSDFRQYTNVETNAKASTLADAYNRIGDCLYQNREFTSADENYSKAAQLKPSVGDYSTFQRGFLLGLEKNYSGKIAMMNRLIQEYPESQYVDDALFEKGRAYVMMENNKDAATAFEKIVKEYPQSSLARKAGIQLGLLYYNDNQPEKSAAAYKQVISKYPGSDEAKVAIEDLKSVYVDMNDVGGYAEYLNSLGDAAKLKVGEQDSLTYLAAERLMMKSDNSAAEKSFKHYLQLYPNGAFSTDANFYLGSIAFQNKTYPEAKTHFANVLKKGSNKYTEETLARMAEMNYNDKDYTSALKYFKDLSNVAESTSNREAALIGIMRCANQTDEPKEALTAAEELLKSPKLSPEMESEARYARAKAYISLKQEGNAFADLKELSKDTRTAYGAEAKYLLAQLYYDNKDDKNAEKELMNFIENGTPHQYWLARGFILLSDVYFRKGDNFQAQQYLISLQKNYKANDDIEGMINERLAKLQK